MQALSVHLTKIYGALWFACHAFGSLVGSWETVTYPGNFDPCFIWKITCRYHSQFPMLNSMNQLLSEEKQSELVYVTIHIT